MVGKFAGNSVSQQPLLEPDSYSRNHQDDRGLFASLYDFGFTSLVTPRLIKGSYAGFVVILTLGGAAAVAYLWSDAPGFAASIAIWYFVLLVNARIVAEYFIHEFLSAADLRAIRREVRSLRVQLAPDDDEVREGQFDDCAVIERALESVDTADDDQAIALLSDAIALDARNSELYALRADKLKSIGRLSLAIDDLNMAIRVSPEEHRLYGARADMRQKLGDNDGAIADYDIALALKPKDRTYHLGRQQAANGSDLTLRLALIALGEEPGATYVCLRCRETYTEKVQSSSCRYCGGDLVDRHGNDR